MPKNNKKKIMAYWLLKPARIKTKKEINEPMFTRKERKSMDILIEKLYPHSWILTHDQE